jgi:ubiquinone/menaquinone biosynthesis C-methylase UbiE
MSETNKTFLPGLEKQFGLLTEKISLHGKKCLVAGAGCEEIAKNIFHASQTDVDFIVDNYDSLINSRLAIQKEDKVNCSFMEYQSTDFKNSSFDLIYAQASVSTSQRRKILREFFRLLKPSGYFCVGEIVKLQNTIPKFVEDIMNASDLFPVTHEELEKLYLSLGFHIIESADYSQTFKDYLKIVSDKANKVKHSLEENEKSYYKKLLNRFSHEANSFLKNGGDKYIGFHVFILQKGE